MPFETALDQWAGGSAPASTEAAPDERPVLELVTARRIEEELRRRLGGAFTTDELAELYDAGTGWVFGLAVAVAPDDAVRLGRPGVGDAAFGRYVREAVDFAGGRRLS